MESVEYREVPGYPGYRVGSDGTVWSQHTVGGGKTPNGEWLLKRPTRHNRSGYSYTGLYAKKKTRTTAVHRLIATVFLGPRPVGMQCRHLNGDQADNRVENLAWGTAQDNADDKAAHGTQVRGSKCGSAKLTESQIVEIKARRRAGQRLRIIAAAFGVHNATISRICTGDQWAHVGSELTQCQPKN